MNRIKLILLLLLAAFVSSAQPVNYDCSHATVITIPASGTVCVNGTLVGDTTGGNSSECQLYDKQVWFSYITAGGNNSVSVSPTGISPGADLTVTIAQADSQFCFGSFGICDAATDSGTASAYWVYPPGTSVIVFVSSNSQTNGTFQLCVSSSNPAPTAGKDCATAINLCSLNPFTASIDSGSNGYAPPCYQFAFQEPVAYKFTVGQTGLLNWTATPSCGPPLADSTEFDWAVYDITNGCPGTIVACNYNYTDGGGGPVTSVQGMEGGPDTIGCSLSDATGDTTLEICPGVTILAGNTYLIYLDQYTRGSDCNATFNFTGSTFTLASVSSFIISNDTICAGEEATLTATPQDTGGTYSWTPGGYNTPSITVSPDTSTTYTVTYTSGQCSSIASPSIIVQPIATPMLFTNDSIICSSDSTRINVLGTYQSYLWNNADSASYIYANKGGGYWVTATDVNGCTAISGHQEIYVYPVQPVSIIVQGDTLSSFNSASYQWYFNDNVIPGATGSIYVVQQSGNYAVQVIDSNGCSALSNNTNISTGINEVDGNSDLYIYPDPAADYVFLSFSGNRFINEIRIINLLGQEVKRQKVPESTSGIIKMELDDLPAGIFEIMLCNQQQFISGKLFAHTAAFKN